MVSQGSRHVTIESRVPARNLKENFWLKKATGVPIGVSKKELSGENVLRHRVSSSLA